MSYEHIVTYIVKAIEAVGITIMVVGGLVALSRSSQLHSIPERRQNSYDQLRRTLGRCMLLGLEVLIVADIVRTVVVDQTFQSVVVLGVIVLIRIVLSFSLEVEIDGTWPWNRADRSNVTQRPPPSRPPTSSQPTTDRPGYDDPCPGPDLGATMDETTPSELGESRWPMAGAVVAVIVLTYLLPARYAWSASAACA